MLSSVRSRCSRSQVQDISSVAVRQLTMKAWQIHNYGDLKELELSSTVKVPHVSAPTDVVVKVHASSINPLDIALVGGFGRTFFKRIRQFYSMGAERKLSEFPLTLGRDFSGVVVDVGKNVKKFKPNDQVWGVVPFQCEGSHAEYIVVPSTSTIGMKPDILSHVEAAALPYVCMTAVSALVNKAGLKSQTLEDKKVLILGGSGGIGTFAIQWLKAKGAYVATTASTSAIDFLTKLGADTIVDYKKEDHQAELLELERFDVILDAVSHTSRAKIDLNSLLKCRGKYVTLTSPMLSNMDSYGMFLGGLGSMFHLASINMGPLFSKYSYHWAYAEPSEAFLNELYTLVNNKKVVPVIEKVYKFDEMVQAFEHVQAGHSRGKSVIDIATASGTETN